MRNMIRKFMQLFFTFIAMRRIGSYIEKPKIFFYTRFSANTHLGKNTSFNGMSIGGCGKVYIGDNFHSGKGCMIVAQNHNYKGKKLPYDEVYVCKDVTIEDNVWLGHRVIILGGVTIGEGAIIQAGSVVVKSIPKYSIAGGHPATVFSSRDIEHYKKLKKERKFL